MIVQGLILFMMQTITLEEAALLNLESDGPQEVSAQEHSSVQAALFDNTDNSILSRR